MTADVGLFLWLLKLGFLVNLWLLWDVAGLRAAGGDPHLILPAQILFVVCGYRCLFPNRYKDNVVLHDSWLSSTLVTRVLATFAEVAWIHQLSYVVRLANGSGVAWVELLAQTMLLLVVLAQLCVWGSILTGRLSLFFWEELSWMVIFVFNTIASAHLYWSLGGAGELEILLQLNLLFGLVYLPWQCIHLHVLAVDARKSRESAGEAEAVTWKAVGDRLRASLYARRRSTDAASWGGAVGLVWMTAYWAALIPVWVHQVVRSAALPD